MSYPDLIKAQLNECNSQSCGTFSNNLEFDSQASPPEYASVSGDYVYARCWRVDLGGGSYTWQLKIINTSAGNCIGQFTFQLDLDTDDPVGDYFRLVNGQKDSTAGKAKVISMD